MASLLLTLGNHNATSAATLGRDRYFLIDDFYDFSDSLIDKIGELPTYILLTYGVLKFQLTFIAWFFLHVEKNRWFQKYKLQPDKYMSEEKIAQLWNSLYGWGQLPGLVLVALPMTISDYYIQKAFGMDMRDRGKGWLDLSWRMVVAIFVWDLWIWVGHVLQHKIPYLYKNWHKLHHEITAPNILAASVFGLIDAAIETTYPVYIGCAVGHVGFFGCHFFQGYFLSWVGGHNHCGYDFPWDILNKIFRYVDKHDAHHELFDTCYQTFLWGCFDKLFGYEDKYNKMKAEKAAAKAAAEAGKGKKGAKVQ